MSLIDDLKAQNPVEDVYQKLDLFNKEHGLKRVDIDGFLLFRNTDTIPYDVFLLPLPRTEYDDAKTMQENFLSVISGMGVKATQEEFSVMRWLMPNLLDEIKKGDYFVIDSDYPPVFNGGDLRVIYGCITYTIMQKQFFPHPSVSSIKVKFMGMEFTIKVWGYSEYGNANLFKSLR
jgi:hypothetical protein